MNCLSKVRSYISMAILKRSSHIIFRCSWSQCCYWPSMNDFKPAGVNMLDIGFLPARFRGHCYSTRRKDGKTGKLDAVPLVDNEKDAFFIVRKGDLVGIYKSVHDCQAQVGSSVFDPPVSVYKGYSMPKDSEEYFSSHGLKNPIYTIRASDLKEDMFGVLTPFLFQEPTSRKFKTSDDKDASKKKSQDITEAENREKLPSSSLSVDPLEKSAKLEPSAENWATSNKSRSCVIEFDGASKGNPGLAGAAAVLRSDDGSLICKLRQGLGIATNNAAEYQGIILGLKYALEKGYDNIVVKGDSKLVCMQMQGLWKVKHKTLTELHKEAKDLSNKCNSFTISHVLREFNSEADAQSNLAARLSEGQVQVE